MTDPAHRLDDRHGVASLSRYQTRMLLSACAIVIRHRAGPTAGSPTIRSKA
jgi:hypothetical protein